MKETWNINEQLQNTLHIMNVPCNRNFFNKGCKTKKQWRINSIYCLISWKSSIILNQTIHFWLFQHKKFSFWFLNSSTPSNAFIDCRYCSFRHFWLRSNKGIKFDSLMSPTMSRKKLFVLKVKQVTHIKNKISYKIAVINKSFYVK